MERPLALVDLILSPSACLVVCDNSTAKLVREREPRRGAASQLGCNLAGSSAVMLPVTALKQQ